MSTHDESAARAAVGLRITEAAHCAAEQIGGIGVTLAIAFDEGGDAVGVMAFAPSYAETRMLAIRLAIGVLGQLAYSHGRSAVEEALAGFEETTFQTTPTETH